MKKNSILLALSALMSLSAVAENQPFLTKAYDFMSAPGQFVNTMPDAEAGDAKESILKRVVEFRKKKDNKSYVSVKTEA